VRIQDNYFQYAMQNYDNPSCSTVEDFNNDLQKVIHIKKLLAKDFNKRLLLNHIIVMLNVFSSRACVVMLFYKIDVKYWSILKTYFEYLSVMPEHIEELGIVSSDIPLDLEVIDELRNL
jgi:hypothetical protein